MSLFDDEHWIVFAAEGGAGYRATRGVDVAKAMHRALVKFGPQPTPELISGRRADGAKLDGAHLAVVPLPDVGHEHARGGLLGLVLLVPRSASPADRRALALAVARFEFESGGNAITPTLPLWMGAQGTWSLRRIEAPDVPGLQGRSWCGPARRWVTATPVALDRNPGWLRSTKSDLRAKAAAEAASAAHAEETVARACERIGLPRPESVSVALAPILAGSAPAEEYAPYPPEPGRIRRVRVHADIAFAEPVLGPVLLGAGRFAGLGICWPLE